MKQAAQDGPERESKPRMLHDVRPTRMGQAGTIAADSPGAVLKGKLEFRWRVGSILTFGGGANEIQRDIIAMAGLWMPRTR